MFKERETLFPENGRHHHHEEFQILYGKSENNNIIRKKQQVQSLASSSGDEGSSPNSCVGIDFNGFSKKSGRMTSISSPTNIINHNNNTNNMRCYSCGKTILDRYYIFAMDRHWHNECLKCQVCSVILSQEPTCFEKDGRILCKQDYYRLYNKAISHQPRRCARCTNLINPNDLVMRACDLVYHVDCFVCTVCQRSLNRGDQFRMQSTDLYCRLHYDIIENFSTSEEHSSRVENSSPNNKSSPPTNNKRGRPPKRKLLSGLQDNLKDADRSLDYFHPTNGKPPSIGLNISSLGAEFNQIMDSPINGFGMPSMSQMDRGVGISINCDGTQTLQQQQKGKRMRTTFKHNQLRVMKTYFDMNPNPDTKDLKQLSQKTGLCKRVLQVWFQNARAKHRRTCPRSESSLSGSGVMQLDDSEEWSPPETFCQPTPTDLVGNLIQT